MDDRTGGVPDSALGLPVAPGVPTRDPRLAGFAKDGEWDSCRPSAALAAALEGSSGPEWRCAGASRDEMIGLLRRWAAIEAWAAAGRLGVLRALIRDDDQPLPGGGYHGDLPDGWTKSLTYEVAAALAVSVPTAENMMWLAWDLQARLPGTASLLADGELTCSKARAVTDTFQLLSDEDAAKAEAMILAELPGKNYGQTKKLAEQAAITVDPDSAARRREDAERNQCRVQLSREESGAAALSGRDLPTDQTLAAHVSVCARAQEYKDSGAFPDDTRMDQYRAAAYLDLLNGIPSEARIASGQIGPVARSSPSTDVGEDGPDNSGPEHGGPGHSASDNGTPDQGGSDNDGSGDPSQGGGAYPSPAPAAPSPSRPADLVIPLAALLGLAERPGEGHGLGPLDPDLCRALAESAAASPASRLCVTVTSPDGIAIGHGCAKPARKRAAAAARDGTLASLPARVNLTIPAARLAELTRSGDGASRPRWSFIHDSGDPGPPGGFGTWTLTLPDGRELTLRLEPVPVFTCDHRHQSHAYQPNDTLRHLVQVRDGECTFPPCSRHARETDFEHATPYHKGGKTCACNAGARSRQCHRVKQSKGWTVTQPRPGWHQWQTPAGRIYTQGPKRYPS
jgi:Domain of unknown function (DUF222)